MLVKYIFVSESESQLLQYSYHWKLVCSGISVCTYLFLVSGLYGSFPRIEMLIPPYADRVLVLVNTGNIVAKFWRGF